MLGNISGDVIGSVWEMNFNTPKEFELFYAWSRFTDDTVLTTAVASVLLQHTKPKLDDFRRAYVDYWHAYPKRGYGKTFKFWAKCRGILPPQNSYGNGCAMRVAPIAWAFDSMPDVLDMAWVSSQPTHTHEEAERGVKAVAGSVFLARTGNSKDEIRRFVTSDYGYDLTAEPFDLHAQFRPSSCMAAVPLALRAFLEGDSYEDTVRRAILFGGDTDTTAAISGGIAEAFYGGVPKEILIGVKPYLDDHIIGIVKKFRRKFILIPVNA